MVITRYDTMQVVLHQSELSDVIFTLFICYAPHVIRTLGAHRRRVRSLASVGGKLSPIFAVGSIDQACITHSIHWEPQRFVISATANVITADEFNRDSTGTGTGTVPGRNDVASVWSRNIFLFWSRTMRSIFVRYLAYNIIYFKQLIDIMVSSNVKLPL